MCSAHEALRRDPLGRHLHSHGKRAADPVSSTRGRDGDLPHRRNHLRGRRRHRPDFNFEVTGWDEFPSVPTTSPLRRRCHPESALVHPIAPHCIGEHGSKAAARKPMHFIDIPIKARSRHTYLRIRYVDPLLLTPVPTKLCHRAAVSERSARGGCAGRRKDKGRAVPCKFRLSSGQPGHAYQRTVAIADC
jgi:hypothetical protein